MKRSTLKKKCDTLFSKIIRSANVCEKCHTQRGKLECAHIISRTYTKVRFNYDNALCLCSGCHFWAHKNPTEFSRWVEEYVGEERIRELEKESKRTDYKVDYEDIYGKLKKEWERINS